MFPLYIVFEKLSKFVVTLLYSKVCRDVTGISRENGIGEQSWSFHQGCLHSYYTNSLGKGIK